ncbi:hypothetical protein [Actinophytocola sediminis]
MQGDFAVPRQQRPAIVIADSRSRTERAPRFQNLVVHAWREWSDAPAKEPAWYREAS